MSNVLDEIVEGVEPWPGVVSVLAGSKRPYLLALDVGTSGIRAGLFDEQGSEVKGAGVRVDHPSHVSNSFGTFDAEALCEQVAQTLSHVVAKFDEPATRIDLIAVSCFWHSLVGIDERHCATTPVFSWADTRAIAATKQLRAELDEKKFHARTGCRFHPSYWPAKLRRLRDEEPEVFRKTVRWLSFADFLALKFFDESATSVSMASGSGLLNQYSCEWDNELLAALGVSTTCLPEIAEPERPYARFADPWAALWPQLSEARLVPAFADGAANSIGSGCHSTDKVSLMIGTSGAMRVSRRGEPPPHVPRELWCYRVNRERVVLGGALSDGGGLIGWLRDSLLFDEDSETIESELDLLSPDSHGLTILPFWAGERSTGWNPNAYGTILGLTSQTRPIEILRAAMEAIAYRFAAIWRVLEPFAPGAQVIASGNALRSSPTWIQILADVLGRRVHVSEASEASLRGAALLALDAAGKIQSIEEISTAVASNEDTVFEPNTSNYTRYQIGLQRQERVYKKLFL
jgi:gluconokinase